MLTAVPKEKTPRDPKYLAFVRRQPSCISGQYCFNEAHHTESGCMGKKGSDYSAVPLAWYEHRSMDNKRKDDIPNLAEIIANLQQKFKNEGGKINE